MEVPKENGVFKPNVEKEEEEWYEKQLPKPPVPSLDATLDSYLEYAAVVAVGQGRRMADTHRAVERFRTEGLPLQRRLEHIAENTKNWITPIWLSEMYLKIRLPLPVNSNPAYIFPKQNFKNVNEQIKYTAGLVRGIVDFKDKIDRKDLEREISTGKQKVRICMEQYDRVLACYRMPRVGEDEQIYKGSKRHGNEHIAVMCNNQVFIVFVRIGGHLISMSDIVYQLTEIVHRAQNRPAELVVPISASSVGNRDRAGLIWDMMCAESTNAKSLEWMKDAMFVVCLDMPTTPRTVTGVEEGLSKRGIHLLTGFGSKDHGLNRWCDATIQLVVSSCGMNGICIEHSTAEGIVIINMAEHAIKFAQEHMGKKLISPNDRQVAPKSLSWVVSNEARSLMDKQIEEFDELADELQLDVLVFEEFGKDFIKKCAISPDGFMQLALQLAHFKAHGHLVSTYESATHRRFGSGRVDNIRANTQEALEWVTAMHNKHMNKARRVQLLRLAAEKQAQITMQNITGYGIDNHLCSLQVLAQEQEKQTGKKIAFFEDPLYSELMRFPLSTSQVTTSAWLPKYDSYLCYGAVVRDGYGCSYNIQPTHLIVAPSAFKSNTRTNLSKFKECIRESLQDMKTLLLN